VSIETCSRTLEQRVEDEKQSPLVKNNVLWTNFEETYAYELATLYPEYRRASFVNNKKIAEKLNEYIHHGELVRNGRAVQKKLYRLRRLKEAEDDDINVMHHLSFTDYSEKS
tara:strand:+ start:237 stop:572 length:336 start_codon:yes stop_codon:yes gene_type:complete